MKQEEMLYGEEFMKCIEAIDLQKDDMAAVYPEMKKRFKTYAQLLHLAHSIVTINISPNPFNPEGAVRLFSMVFSDDSGPEDQTIVSDKYTLLGGYAIAKMYPVNGHVWTEEEKRSLRVMSKFISMMVSRAALVNNLREIAFMDAATGLANQPGIRRFVDEMDKQGKLDEYGFIFFNLKNFKYLNQRFGRSNGDLLLRKYSLELYRFANKGEEMVSRPGGDNFMVFLKKERVADFLEFAQHISIPLQVRGKTIPVEMPGRFGVYIGGKGDSCESMFRNASFAMNKARDEKTDVAYFTKELLDRMMEGQRLAVLFPKAVQMGEIVPFYQPKVEVPSKKLCGAEALARWIQNGKVLSPGQFLPALEHAGEIHSLDIYMLDAICKDIRRWLDAGLEPVRISVNFDKSDLVVPTIVQDTIAILNKYGLDGSHIEIELTELSSYDNIDRLGHFIKEMHEHHIKVAMDDFGSGYSSLNFLKDTDFNAVKLDKSFVGNIERHMKKDEVMLRGMVSMLKDINVEVVAEGVETKEQATYVRDIQCNVIQGFYFDKPMPAKDFEKRLRQKTYD